MRTLLADRLGVLELPLAPILASLCPPPPRMDAFYDLLLAWSNQAPRVFVSMLADARCIRLSGDQWVRPSDGACSCRPNEARWTFRRNSRCRLRS